MKTYRDLLVWQKAMTFVTTIYQKTKSFPKEESYGLTSQVRRSAISIPSNIAEGFGRNSNKEFIRFLQISMGSIFEIQTQLEISVNLEYLRKQGHSRLSGIEINRAAVALMPQIFPDLDSVSTIHLGPFEEIVPGLPANSVDIVLTMATAMHIHPHNHRVFQEMVRVANRYVCVVELERANNAYLFARNYARIFAKLGCTQLKSATLDRGTEPQVGPDYHGYTIRLFDMSNAKTGQGPNARS